MRVSCACPAEMATSTLVENLRAIGIQPIVTNTVIRAVYEGPDRTLGEAIVDMFSHEADHEITMQFTEEEHRKLERKLGRKFEAAERNARLHGHPL